ncbi:hypothetical protein AHMF7616_00960 [Adhaeribacter pallidiroseus]|uniref:Uncharacterized protein n=1 Tax=Adhaeribacter pallidiroseus TaxID=2072847 RepID=A0A369QGH3_9BACT|nr:hypothetical protein AHMF7616_00960 [Adhaeribacter pallidiroseus]
MKNFIITLISMILIGIASSFYLKPNIPTEKKLRHVVAFKFKLGTTPEQMQKATMDFLNLNLRCRRSSL